MTRISFLYEAVDSRQVGLLGLEEGLGPHADKHNQDKAHEDGNHRHQREDNIGSEHHNQDCDNHDDRRNHIGQTLVKGLTDGVHVVGHP